MKGSEFLRKLKGLGRDRKVNVVYLAHKGKGSHGTVYFGRAFTRLKDMKKELGTGLLHGMCEDLGINTRDLEGR